MFLRVDSIGPWFQMIRTHVRVLQAVDQLEVTTASGELSGAIGRRPTSRRRPRTYRKLAAVLRNTLLATVRERRPHSPTPSPTSPRPFGRRVRPPRRRTH